MTITLSPEAKERLRKQAAVIGSTMSGYIETFVMDEKAFLLLREEVQKRREAEYLEEQLPPRSKDLEMIDKDVLAYTAKEQIKDELFLKNMDKAVTEVVNKPAPEVTRDEPQQDQESPDMPAQQEEKAEKNEQTVPVEPAEPVKPVKQPASKKKSAGKKPMVEVKENKVYGFV